MSTFKEKNHKNNLSVNPNPLIAIEVLKQAKVKIWYLFRYKPKIIRILQHNKLQNFQNVQKTLYFQIDDERQGEFDNIIEPPLSKRT